MSKRFGKILAAVVAAGLAMAPAPAPAGAATPTVSFDDVESLFGARARGGSNRMFVFFQGPGRVNGYQWAVTAFKRNPRSKTLLSIVFQRGRAQATQYQVSEFTWELPRGALRMAPDLKPASVDTAKGMGNNGSIDMRLTRTEGYVRIPAGEGCSGELSARVGRLGGRLRFNARDDFFGRISLQGVQATVFREHDYRCREAPPAPPCPQHLSFNAVDEEAGVAVGAFKTLEGKVDQTVVAVRPLQTGRSTHTISVTLAVPEAFEASDDLTSASIDGDVAEPWLSGDLSYVAPPASEGTDERCGPYEESSGLATGDYTAHFDSIGDVTPAPTTGMSATLRREI